MIVFLSIFTLVSLIIINLGIINKKVNVKNTGFIMLFFAVVVGWFILGISIKFYTDTKIPITLDKENGKMYVIVKDSIGDAYFFNRQIDFNNITDTTTFYLEKNTNMYHFNSEKCLYYKIDDKKFKSEEYGNTTSY